MLDAIAHQQSLLLIGESGSGKTTLARRTAQRLSVTHAIVDYIRGKQAVIEIAQAFGVELTEPRYNSKGEVTGDRKLTQEELEAEILETVKPGWALFVDNADRWSQSLRLWLMQVERRGVVLILLCTKQKQVDIFLRRTRIDIPKPTAYEIREIMQRHCGAIAHPLTPQEIADLQQYAGLNLGVAKLVVEQHQQGIKPKADQHRNTIVIAPYASALLGGFAVLRFVGLGMNNKTLYIIGGVCLVLFLTIKSIGYETSKPQRGIGQ